MSTLSIPCPLPSPKDDAIQLNKAFKGFGCDKDVVIKILGHRDAAHRYAIQCEYHYLHPKEDLVHRLSKELSGDLEKAMSLWLPDPAARDALILNRALVFDPNLEAATEVICTRTPSQIQYLKQVYHFKFCTSLEQDIENGTSGDHRKLLLAYITNTRYDGLQVDKELAKKDAITLYKAGEKRLGTNEKTFIQIFSERSRAHMSAVNAAYRELYGHSLKKGVKKETSGPFKDGLVAIIQCENPAKYFAKVLYRAMKGLGTNETRLTRVIVTRTEIDMKYIKVEYFKKYKKQLTDAVRSETSGHYKTFLLELLGPNT